MKKKKRQTYFYIIKNGFVRCFAVHFHPFKFICRHVYTDTWQHCMTPNINPPFCFGDRGIRNFSEADSAFYFE